MIQFPTLLVVSLLALCGVALGQNHFEGVTITVGVQNVPAIGGPAKAHARSWEARTGGQVRVLEYPFGELYATYMKGLRGEGTAFDVLLYAPAWAGDFYPYLAELPHALAEDESFDDIHPTYRDRLMKWDGAWIAVTLDGDMFSGYYRKDLFDDPQHQTDFRTRYGYDLGPPHTWRHYHDIAAFFTERTGPDGRRLYGTTEAFVRGGQQFWNAFARAAAYTNPPDRRGWQFFDPETMVPQINNPGWVRAIEDYVAIVQFCPPQALRNSIVDSRRLFAAGDTAMSLDWGDTGTISANPSLSVIADKVGYFVLPGSQKVWDGVSGRWLTFDKPHKVPFLAFGGWVASVPKASRHKAAAWNYIMWYSNPENSLSDVVNGDSGINPYRFTHFSSIDAWTRVFSRRAAAEFLGVLKASLDSPNVALDLRLPGFNDYTQAFEEYLTRALARDMPVKDALDAVAATWEAITEQRGRAQQRALYRASIGLPPG